MSQLKILFKKNTHSPLFKALAGFGRSMNRFYENRNHDSRSNGEIVVIQKIQQRKPTLIIDGGANVGSYSQLLRKYTSAVIHAFEPVESTYQKLCKNLEKQENTFLHHTGLFKENCSKEINLYKSSTHSSIYESHGINAEPSAKTTIKLIKGDDFMKEHSITHIDFLKLDLEGAEYDALEGFQEALSNQAITAVQFEYGYINVITKKLLFDYYQFFEQYGYQIGKIFPRTVEFRRYNFMYEDFLGPNFIAVRKQDKALIQLLERK